jgi:hypothetical protein
MQTLTHLAAVLAMMLVAVPAVSAMSDYKWTKRPLVVFAPGDEDERLLEQRRIVEANRAALAERDMVVIWVVGNTTTTDLGAQPRIPAAGLRSRYGVADGAFRVVLIGKDGGAKLSSAMPISADRVIETIEAMPMRREEMRRR